ncbi:amidohydrolase [Mesorhizobium sp. L-8-10]|uniref:amidohydrolase family protein n=1 Tax=unclassified Mesorhizobium TaxID=325217 RepID=UPI001925B7A4|nr:MULTISPECIES: amidohydrolase family protein [unclassified Mesorhizobium]BCH21440.1 amidohydrolase [Mesorhizobium sp. L-8-3]BCH29274.1 amidohydrolase [Mesorhizobium sp. L-8-10]
MISIIDAHHHVWHRADLPWLQGPMVPRIFGPYEPIRRDYPIEEFLADISGSGVEKSVYVQTNWAKTRAVDEVAWVQGIADAHRWPHAIVGYADLMDETAGDTLERQSEFALMRGIRMQLHWHDNEMYRFAPRPDLMNEAVFRRNLRRLAHYGWSFDLQVFASQMADAARLATDNQDITFILQHAGMPEDRTTAGHALWRDGMKRLADRDNVVTKLSGLGTFSHRNDPADIAEIVAETVAIFGSERCLFGSNFPIEKLWTSYEALVSAFRAALAPYPSAAQDAMFRANAARIYRIR